jgi:hypothetical protein
MNKIRTSLLGKLVLQQRAGMQWGSIVFTAFVVSTFSPAAVSLAGDKTKEAPGFVVELPAKESDVLQAVKEIAEDSDVRGTYVYEGQKTLTGAIPAKTSDVFAQSQEPGAVFYKVLTGALAPRHFLDSSDMGTITVRYVVQPVAEARTRVRIDAVFVEAGRRRAHASDGTVEASEGKAIQNQLQEIQLTEQKAAADSKKHGEEDADKASVLRERQEEAARLEAAQSSIRDLQQRLQELRHQLELRVKEPNTALKSAPFQRAAKLESLGAGTVFIVLIVTTYWYGVETTEGHRGWLRRDQVEPLP